MKIERRTFLKQTGVTVAGVCLGCAGATEAADSLLTPYADGYRVEASKLIIDLAKNPKLKEVGGSAKFEVEKRKIIVVHPVETDYKAFENKCTHKGWGLNYHHKDAFIKCDLHGSQFGIDGHVIKGPAALALPEFKTGLEKDELTVYLS
jgi:Rieske Fe-S protein